MRIAPWSAPVLLALAGCAAPAPVAESAVPYTATRALQARGETEVTIHAAHRVLGATRALSGIPCLLEADGFRAEFSAPARVRVPDLQDRTPPARVTCTRGTETARATLAAYNLTTATAHRDSRQRMAGTRDFGGLGAITAALVTELRLSGRDPGRDVWTYPDTTVTFGL